MTKNEREVYQRNLMVAVKLVAEAFSLEEPVRNLERAQEMLRQAINLAKIDAVEGV